MNNGPPETTDTERVVQEVLAQIDHDSQRYRGGRHKKPTLGPKRVRSADRGEVKPASHIPSSDSQRGRSFSVEGWSRRCGEPAQCYKCKGFRHFAKHCLSDGYCLVGPNGLLFCPSSRPLS